MRLTTDVVAVRYLPWGSVVLLYWAPVWMWPERMPCPEIEEALLMGLSRPTKPPTGNGGYAAPSGPGDEDVPLLVEYLSATTYDDGTPRQTSTLLLMAQDGAWKACLRDREQGMCLWVAAPSFGALIGVVEASLGLPDAPWRLDRASGHPTASRQPKRS